ncbi:MAG: hypothetical protein CMJ35_04045 [Phycisphaerae bacterium]|nr:hypothetical protein [Phycisphaerae bacterium]MBM90770.1 hypothetical protein [Phycisphaerae bacterium]HCT45258.1 hypothetical protein [Phycisphaerales bacterium]
MVSHAFERGFGVLEMIRQRWVLLSVTAWAVACVSVFVLLWSYANVPGAQGMLPVGWTAATELERPDDRAMLLVFAHPKCPCTRATMTAIERLQREVPSSFATRVVFYEPADADASWRQTDLWARANKLVDAKAIADPGGTMTLDAGAVVSGCVALFDRDGQLRFWGGITPSRGHEGESVGLGAIRSVLRGQGAEMTSAPVYGCEIAGACVLSMEVCGERDGDASIDE